MDVEASLRYWGGVVFQGVPGGLNVDKVSEVIEVGWTEGRKL